MRQIKSALLFVFILVVSAACNWSYNEEESIPESNTEERIEVRTAPIKTRSVTISKNYIGQLHFGQSTVIMAEMPGTVQGVKWKTGETIRNGQTLLSYPRLNDNLDIENKDLEQAEIAFNELKQNYERQRILLDKGAVTKASVEQLKAQMDVQKKVMEQVKLGIKKNHTIKAPYGGIITEVFVQNGQQHAPGTPLLSIAKPGRLEVVFFVIPEDIHALKTGGQIKLFGTKDSTTATITEVSPAIDPSRKAFQVVAVLNEIKNGFYSGSSVEIELVLQTINDALVIQEENVQKIGSDHFVYLATNERATLRKVELGRRFGLDILVESGLEPGELLITAGMEKLKADAPITAIQ